MNSGQFCRSHSVYRIANAMPKATAKVPSLLDAAARDVVGADRGEPPSREISSVHIQGLGHDPTPRKSLATWPTANEYQTVKARKMVTHLRAVACSSDRGSRQKYQ